MLSFSGILNGRDHLHTRGEYLIMVKQITDLTGSPPHTWRILTVPKGQAGKLRITSTHVENTFGVSATINTIKGSPPHTWRIQ